MNFILPNKKFDFKLKYYSKSGRIIISEESNERLSLLEEYILNYKTNWNISLPNDYNIQIIKNTHSEDLVNKLFDCSKKHDKEFWLDKELDWSTKIIGVSCTPLFSEVFNFAKQSVDMALTGADLILNGKNLVYSLNRPPGHHSEKDKIGGFCYFNNVAIAANYLKKVGKIAILDFDVHHGNGTQQIFYEDPNVLYVSLHEDPWEYPQKCGYKEEKGIGKGRGFNFNFPLPYKSNWSVYYPAFLNSMDIINKFNPSILVVSAGYDAVEGDLVGNLNLKSEDYNYIASTIKKLKIPLLIIQEGGYIPEKNLSCATRFIEGLISETI